jgi:hypothetical protein
MNLLALWSENHKVSTQRVLHKIKHLDDGIHVEFDGVLSLLFHPLELPHKVRHEYQPLVSARNTSRD